MQQIYSNYTKEDFLVWKLLFERQMNNLSDVVSVEYTKALAAIEFTPEKIPDFEETNGILKNFTGWALHVVPNIIPAKDFFQLLNKRKFSATAWLRKLNQLDYLEEPDMFHDVFGHVPLLTNQAYCDFFEGISKIALRNSDNEEAIEMLGRIYWFTIEFGLIREDGKTKIYGAGIISSPGETAHSLSSTVKHLNYNVKEIMSTSFRTDIFQDKYFVIESFDQLYGSLIEIEKLINKEVKKEESKSYL